MNTKRGANCVAPRSADLTSLDILLWNYKKDSRRVNTLDELKTRITTATAKCYKGYVTACMARGGLYVGCMQNYRWRSL
jgi:hypothetical protein